MTSDLAYLTEVALCDRELFPRSCWAWLSQEVQTIDEASRAVRRWPDKAALHDLVDVLSDDSVRRLAIIKSRRVMATWTVAEWVHWTTRYHPAVLAVWQSRTEEMAADVLTSKIVFAEEHLIDQSLRRRFHSRKTTTGGGVGRIVWETTASRIVAVAQGADAFRSLTPSILVIDECEFQEQAWRAFAAALPFAEKNAKIVLLSTSNGPGRPISTLCKDIGFTRWTG